MCTAIQVFVSFLEGPNVCVYIHVCHALGEDGPSFSRP